MNLQAIEQKLVSVLSGAEQAAAVLAAQIPNFIKLADEATTFVDDAAKALKGADKLQLVKKMAEAALDELNLGADFAAVWAVLGPLITLIVQLRKLGLLKL